MARVEVIDPRTAPSQHYAERLYELRQRKGLTELAAQALITKSDYYAAVMVDRGDADGMVRELVRDRRPDLEIDGEMQPEVALDPARRQQSYNFSRLSQPANTLVFGSLAAGNAATKRWRFSDRQELLEETCFGRKAALSPFLENGAARIVYSYGRPGEKAMEMYYDERGRPFTAAQGFAGIKYKHDLLGREIEVTYVDAQENQILTKDGYARVANTYNARGDLVERAYFQANDNPTSPVAKIESEFDALRRKVNDRYLGPGGKPALPTGRGQHVTLYEYDEYGNVRALHYLNTQGRPTRGFARELDDTWQLCSRWLAYYGEDGKLIGNGGCL